MGKTTLIVDDDRALRETLTEALELEGYTVVAGRHGLDGLNQLIGTKPDVILLDVVMPRMEGYGFIEQLRRRLRANAI